MYLHYVSSRSTSDRLPGNESPLLNPKSKMNGKRKKEKIQVKLLLRNCGHSCRPSHNLHSKRKLNI